MNLQSCLCNVVGVAFLALSGSGAVPGHALQPAPAGVFSSHHRHRHKGSGYLGVNFENLTTQERTNLHIAAKEGVAIAAVDHDAPAGKAGLRSNDIIVRMNGKNTQHADDLRAALRKMPPGQTIVLDILRDDRPLKFIIVLADRETVEQQAWPRHDTVPDPRARPASQSRFLGAVPSEIGKTFSSNGGLMSLIPGTAPYTGITVDVLTPQLSWYFGLKGATVLLVRSVDLNSPGSRAGLHAGDVIWKANDALMTSRGKWSHALRENRHEAVKLQILRNKQPQTLLLTLAPGKS